MSPGTFDICSRRSNTIFLGNRSSKSPAGFWELRSRQFSAPTAGHAKPPAKACRKTAFFALLDIRRPFWYILYHEHYVPAEEEKAGGDPRLFKEEKHKGREEYSAEAQAERPQASNAVRTPYASPRRTAPQN